MQKLTLPYVKSTPKAKVIWAEDITIEMLDTHLRIVCEVTEEQPHEDELLGTKESRTESITTLPRSLISAVTTTYDSIAECYDVNIYVSGSGSWGYNCRTKAEAHGYHEQLSNWLTQ